METLIILAKSAAILSLFYVIYLAILRKDTFFTANRHFLLSGIVAAIVLPFITFTKVIYTTIPDVAPIVPNDFNPEAWEALPPVITETPVNWWQVALVIYIVGVAIMGIRFAAQLISLLRLIHSNTKVHKGGYTFVKTNTDLSPFSFFKYIVYNPALHTERELELILTHEKVHASQWHTADVLLTQLALCIQWINPMAWLYKKSLEQNLEFIADHAAINAVDSTKEYQLTLVKVSSTALRPALTNQFYHSLIKKRIVMLNKEASRRRNLWKLGLVLPVLGLFMYSFNVETEYKVKEDSGASDAFAKAEIDNTAEQVFKLQATMTDAEIETLIKQLESQAKNLEIRFTKRKRNASGELLSLMVETKYPSQPRFYQNVTYGEENATPLPDIIFQIVNENDLQFSDFENKMIFRTSLDGVKAELLPNSEKPLTPSIGEKPLYILNGEKKTSEEVKNKTFELDGEIQMLGKQEATQTYGEEAKDGALVFKGTTIVKNEETPIQEKVATPISRPRSEGVTEEVAKYATNQQDNIYKFVITKNTTIEEIKTIKQKLKDYYNASLKYSDVDFNAQGEITSIRLKFKDDDGNSSNYHTSSQTAIRDIYIYREADGSTGLGNYGSKAQLEEEMEKRLFQRRERMEARQGEMQERRKELMEKREERREEMEKRRSEMREEMENRSEGARQEMRERRKEMEKREKRLFERAKSQERSKTLFDDKDAIDEIPRPLSTTVPLYILDEKEVKYEDIRTLLDPNKIKSVSVLKGKSALALYGTKGKNGVIVIESKE